MNTLTRGTEIKEEELQSRLDGEFMGYITSMITYILNPQEKLPPQLKDNNVGFIFASNLLNLAAELDFEEGIVRVNKNNVVKRYTEIQELMNREYNPDNNLCYYPLHMIKSSNSSKFIHGLPYIEIMEKWDNEFEQNPYKLRDYIDSLREKLHIDIDIEIVSAKVIKDTIYLRIENEGFDVTIPLGYSTKHEVFTTEEGKTIELYDCFGNIFSPQGAESIDYYYSDEELKSNIDNIHEKGGTFMLNFFAWRAPEYVTQDNFHHYYHKILDDSISDEDAIINFGGVVHHFKNGMRVLINQVNGEDGNFLATTQDQILPNYGNRKGTEDEQLNYDYWKNTYEKELIRLVDLGVDSFRIDLAHGFRKNNDCNLLRNLIIDIVEYAEEKYDKKIFFILETYDFSNYGGTNPATFRDWNDKLLYPAVKVYHKEIEDKISEVRNYGGLDNLMGDLEWLLQDIRGVNGEMMAASTFDDYTLSDIAEKSGIHYKYILEFQILLGKAGFNILSLDRDFLGEHGEIIPTVPGGSEEHYGTGKFKTHTFTSQYEFQKHADRDSKDIYENSDAINILKDIEKKGNIKGISIDKESKKLIFTFDDNNRRVFEFGSLMNGGEPYTEYSLDDTKILSKEISSDLLKFEDLISTIKETTLSISILPHAYDFNFWFEFANYIKLEGWKNNRIEEWDIKKQEAYFILNRDELINNFFSYKKIENFNNNEVLYECVYSQEVMDLKAKLEGDVKKIIYKNIGEKYPDLLKE